jgi:uncharacterized protein DUF29
MSNLYDTDVALWSEHQADLLRRRAAGQLVNDPDLDWSNIAEEIEDVGANLASSLDSRIGTIVEHLMRLQASPATDPRRGWMETILRSRRDIRKMLRRSPSLRRYVAGMVADAIVDQRELVAQTLRLYDEAPVVDLNSLHYTEEQVLGDWFPNDPGYN